MTEHRSFPPPDQADARFDAVVRRGRALRRRRQIGAGAGAGGVLALAAVAVIVATGGSGGDPDSGVVADSPTTTTTTTTTTLPPADPQITLEQVDGVIVVGVSDDDAAGTSSIPARQCVTLRLVDGEGPAVSEATGCTDEVAADAIRVLYPSGGVEIGCAATVVNGPGAEPVVETPLSSTFRFQPDASVPVGDYTVEVTAVSGIGDGCAPSDTGEHEDVSTASLDLTVG